VVVLAVVSVVVVVVSVVVVCVSVVLELIGAGVSTMTGVGAGVSTITGVGAGVITVVSVVVVLAVVSTVAGDCVIVTSELLFLGMRFTFVFVPTPDPLPVEPTELLVYARPLLSTAAGPEITAGVDDVPTPSVLAGACTVATVVPLLSAVAGASVRIWP
jgi:hypothetical protein